MLCDVGSRALATALSAVVFAGTAPEIHGRAAGAPFPRDRTPPVSPVRAGPADRPGAEVSPAAPDTGSAGPPVASDALLLGGGTVVFALAAPWIRPHLLEHFSLDRVRRNLTDPIGRLDPADDDHFLHNFVSHPVAWGGLGVVLRERGYGKWAALGVTQAHSVWWEYVVEGSWKPPSRVDVVVNLVAPAVAIFALQPAAESLWGEGDAAGEPSVPEGSRRRHPAPSLGAARAEILVLSVSVP